MRKFIVVAALSMLTSCAGSDSNKGDETTKDAPLTQSKNSSDFNVKFTTFLDNYYHLKDAFVLSNEAMAVTSANLLAGSADSVHFNTIKVDSNITQMANGYMQTITSEAKALVQEKDIEAKRKSFQMISDAMYDLVRTVRFDKQVVYHQFCPMAFNDAGAYWLSSSADVKNPYYGKKMLTCGEVKDSIDFRGK